MVKQIEFEFAHPLNTDAVKSATGSGTTMMLALTVDCCPLEVLVAVKTTMYVSGIRKTVDGLNSEEELPFPKFHENEFAPDEVLVKLTCNGEQPICALLLNEATGVCANRNSLERKFKRKRNSVTYFLADLFLLMVIPMVMVRSEHYIIQNVENLFVPIQRIIVEVG